MRRYVSNGLYERDYMILLTSTASLQLKDKFNGECPDQEYSFASFQWQGRRLPFVERALKELDFSITSMDVPACQEIERMACNVNAGFVFVPFK